MNVTLRLYVVDEKKMAPRTEGSSGKEKDDKRIATILNHGASWALMELKQNDLIGALEKIDAQIGSLRLLTRVVFNDKDSSCSHLSHAQVKDLHACLESLPEAWVDALLNSDDEVTKEVLYAFQSSAEEAVKRGHALAVIHSS